MCGVCVMIHSPGTQFSKLVVNFNLNSVFRAKVEGQVLVKHALVQVHLVLSLRVLGAQTSIAGWLVIQVILHHSTLGLVSHAPASHSLCMNSQHIYYVILSSS